MRKLLIVEDEPVVALDLHEEVEQFGWEVVGIVESAEEAMAMAEIYRPDLALMDINIAGGMDGIQAARLLRSAYQIPSVFLTSYRDDATIQRAVKEGPYGYVTKPYHSQELKATLMVALGLLEADEATRADQGAVWAAVSAMRDGLVTVSVSGSIQFMNTAAEKLAGVLPMHARGRKLMDVLAMKDAYHNDVDGKILPRDGCELEGFGWTIRQPNGSPLPIDVLFAPMANGSGELTGYAVTLRNAAARLSQEAVA